MKVCIFASSSNRISSAYKDAASDLGSLLALDGHEIIFGGGGIGLMGILADAALAKGARVTGVIPSFMDEEGWGHKSLDNMIVTHDMNERKRTMFSLADAVVSLPGGVGTLEELTEAITLKQLSLFFGPVIILNTSGFYDNLLSFLDNMASEHFLRQEHKAIWNVVNTPAEVLQVLKNPQDINEAWRKIAKID